jgi:hypothetical protein
MIEKLFDGETNYCTLEDIKSVPNIMSEDDVEISDEELKSYIFGSSETEQTIDKGQTLALIQPE